MPDTFGGMKVDWPVMGGAPLSKCFPGVGLCIEILDPGVEFADSAQSERVGKVQLFQNTLRRAPGIDGGETDKSIRSTLHPIGNNLVVPAASGGLLPIPTQENRFLDTRKIHSMEHFTGGCPALN